MEETGLPEKTTDLSKITDKLIRIIFWRCRATIRKFKVTCTSDQQESEVNLQKATSLPEFLSREHHNIAEVLLKVALNTITITEYQK
jgi:hypothetical protein